MQRKSPCCQFFFLKCPLFSILMTTSCEDLLERDHHHRHHHHRHRHHQEIELWRSSWERGSTIGSWRETAKVRWNYSRKNKVWSKWRDHDHDDHDHDVIKIKISNKFACPQNDVMMMIMIIMTKTKILKEYLPALTPALHTRAPFPHTTGIIIWKRGLCVELQITDWM